MAAAKQPCAATSTKGSRCAGACLSDRLEPLLASRSEKAPIIGRESHRSTHPSLQDETRGQLDGVGSPERMIDQKRLGSQYHLGSQLDER